MILSGGKIKNKNGSHLYTVASSVFMPFLFVFEGGQKQLLREPFAPKCCIMFIIQLLRLSTRSCRKLCLSGHFNLMRPHAVAGNEVCGDAHGGTPELHLSGMSELYISSPDFKLRV